MDACDGSNSDWKGGDMINGLQLAVLASTVIVLALTCILAYFLTLEYIRKKLKSHLFWSAGLWLFALGVALEVLFAYGIYSEFLIKSYLFIVVLLVEALALGSIQLVKSSGIRFAYYAFVIASSAAVFVSLMLGPIGNVLQDYVVFGLLPTWVTITSAISTFVAAIILVAVAAIGYKQRRSRKMLYIIAGVVVVSVAGTLYIAAFPEFLYFSEFFGILLLWLGFFDFGMLKAKR